MAVEQFSAFTDTPLELDAAPDGEPRRSRIQVGELGKFKDPRYGDFAITKTDVANWQQLLSSHFHGQVPIDEDHKTDKGVSSEASAWITGLDIQGRKVMADVEWTGKGADAVANKRYRYISPTFVADLKNKRGDSLGPALLRAALTNNPFLHDMAPVSLSAQSLLAERIADPEPTPDAADSRGAMELTKFTEALGLDKDATEDQVLAAIIEARKPAEKPEPVKTLEAQATEAGKVLLDAGEVTELQRKANLGEHAAAELAATKFDSAFTLALDQGRIDAKPETRERFQKLFTLDQDLTLTTLAELPVVAPTRPSGYGPGAGIDSTEAPDNVDADRHELHQQIEAYMAENKVDYPTALEQVAF